MGDAGVVHENVDARVAGLDQGEDGLDALGVRHVTLQRGGASAGLLDRLDGGGRFVGVEVERDELGSLARNSCAIAAPMPEPAPVTMATFRWRSNIMKRRTISQPSGEVKVTARVCVYFIAKVSRLAGRRRSPGGALFRSRHSAYNAGGR